MGRLKSGSRYKKSVHMKMKLISSEMQFSLLIVFFTLYISDCVKLSGFNLDRTENLLNGLDHDCLYYNVLDKEHKVFQIIQYCIRFQFNDSMIDNKNYHSWHTFNDLYQANITSHQLYDWSAPVDVIENYENYLENKNSFSGKLIFYNCTSPWFGSRCEYRFDQPEPTFSQQLETSFEMKTSFFLEAQKISCYIHLQCDRAGDRGQTPGACLDWREVCDGKVDCLDGGHDEEQCWQLEINECDNQTEFRCHIGLCIPLDFLNDDPHNADCLDQSDEGFTGVLDYHLALSGDKMKDLVKPNFRWEEHMCHLINQQQNMLRIECGYLQCSALGASGASCPNRKFIVLEDAYYVGANISKECYNPLRCLINMRIGIANALHKCNSSFLSKSPELVKQYCPALIKFPPILFGHVRFVYRNDHSWVSKLSINIVLCQNQLTHMRSL